MDDCVDGGLILKLPLTNLESEVEKHLNLENLRSDEELVAFLESTLCKQKITKKDQLKSLGATLLGS